MYKDTVSLKGKVGVKKGKVVAKLDRQVEIARMYVQGFTQVEIAHRLGMDQPNVSVQLKKIREEWLQSIVADYGEIKAKELAKIDNMEATAWQAWERSCKDAEQETKKIQSAIVHEYEKGEETSEGMKLVRKSTMTPIKEHFETLKRGRDGNPAFLDRVCWCIEMRLKIFGILKEDKKEVNQTINFNFDSLIPIDETNDPIEQKILEIEALPSPNPTPVPSSNGHSNGES